MRSKTTAAVFALLFGWLGIHKFYLGETSKGILYMVFFWTIVPIILSVIDGIKFLTMTDEAFNAKYNPQPTFATPIVVETDVKINAAVKVAGIGPRIKIPPKSHV